MASSKTSSPGSQNSSEKMPKSFTSESRSPPSLQSIKSLPVGFRFTGSPTSGVSGQSDDVNTENSDVICDSIPENGEVVGAIEDGTGEMDQASDDTPYDRKTIAIDERPSVGDEDLGFVAPHLRSVAPSRSEFRWADTTSYAAKKKLQSWFLLPNGNWELGKILSTSGTETVISLPEGKVLKVNTDSLLPANPDILDGVDDLMQLSYLNEPSVLYNLQHRYNQDMIYTKAGPVLVAINPFKEVPLYGNDYIDAYKRKSIESPHVYAITDTAIREMRRGCLSFC